MTGFHEPSVNYILRFWKIFDPLPPLSNTFMLYPLQTPSLPSLQNFWTAGLVNLPGLLRLSFALQLSILFCASNVEIENHKLKLFFALKNVVYFFGSGLFSFHFQSFGDFGVSQFKYKVGDFWIPVKIWISYQ